MLTQSLPSEANDNIANLDFDSYLKKKDKLRKVKKVDTFYVDNIRCAIGISGRLFTTSRLYCVYPLMVETGSLFYRALVDDNPKEYFKHTTKVVTKQGIYYETVDRLKKFHFKGSKGAQDHLEKLKGECQEGKCIVTGKHYYLFSNLSQYCKSESGNSIGEKAAMLHELKDLVVVRTLEDGEYAKIRESIMKAFGKCLKAEIDTMTACLDIIPFSFKGTEVKFFFVDCTRFYMAWKIWDEDHYFYHHSDAVKNCLFLFILSPEGKLRGLSDLTYLNIPELSINYFTGTSWDDLPYNSKVVIKPIESLTEVRESDKKNLKDYIAPGSILRLDDDNVAVCLENGEIMRVGPKADPETPNSASSGSSREKLEDYLSENKDCKKVQVLLNPSQIRDLENELPALELGGDAEQPLSIGNLSMRHNSLRQLSLETMRQPSLRLSRGLSNCSIYDRPTHVVIGLQISLKPGALKKMLSKPSVLNMQF